MASMLRIPYIHSPQLLTVNHRTHFVRALTLARANRRLAMKRRFSVTNSENNLPMFQLNVPVVTGHFRPNDDWSIQLKRRQVIFRAQVGNKNFLILQKPVKKSLKDWLWPYSPSPPLCLWSCGITDHNSILVQCMISTQDCHHHV